MSYKALTIVHDGGEKVLLQIHVDGDERESVEVSVTELKRAVAKLDDPE
jgi:hypothetical protein